MMASKKQHDRRQNDQLQLQKQTFQQQQQKCKAVVLHWSEETGWMPESNLKPKTLQRVAAMLQGAL